MYRRLEPPIPKSLSSFAEREAVNPVRPSVRPSGASVHQRTRRFVLGSVHCSGLPEIFTGLHKYSLISIARLAYLFYSGVLVDHGAL